MLVIGTYVYVYVNQKNSRLMKVLENFELDELVIEISLLVVVIFLELILK